MRFHDGENWNRKKLSNGKVSVSLAWNENFGYWHSFQTIRCRHFWRDFFDLQTTNFQLTTFTIKRVPWQCQMPTQSFPFAPEGMRIQFKFPIKFSRLEVCSKHAHNVWIRRNDVKTLWKSIGGEKLKKIQSNYFVAKCLSKSSQRSVSWKFHGTTRESGTERRFMDIKYSR